MFECLSVTNVENIQFKLLENCRYTMNDGQKDEKSLTIDFTKSKMAISKFHFALMKKLGKNR